MLCFLFSRAFYVPRVSSPKQACKWIRANRRANCLSRDRYVYMLYRLDLTSITYFCYNYYGWQAKWRMFGRFICRKVLTCCFWLQWATSVLEIQNNYKANKKSYNFVFYLLFLDARKSLELSLDSKTSNSLTLYWNPPREGHAMVENYMVSGFTYAIYHFSA